MRENMEKEIYEQFLREVKTIKDKYGVNHKDIADAFKRTISEDAEMAIIQRTKENSKYMGKCYIGKTCPRSGLFPEMKKFYKVVGIQSCDEYSVECLTFYEHPIYWFQYRDHAVHIPGDYYLGNFDFSSFQVQHAKTSLLDGLEECTAEEYAYYATKYVAELLDMPWETNHYRYGGKLPADEGWKVLNEEHKNV